MEEDGVFVEPAVRLTGSGTSNALSILSSLVSKPPLRGHSAKASEWRRVRADYLDRATTFGPDDRNVTPQKYWFGRRKFTGRSWECSPDSRRISRQGGASHNGSFRAYLVVLRVTRGATLSNVGTGRAGFAKTLLGELPAWLLQPERPGGVTAVASNTRELSEEWLIQLG
jgi:hypothetical protein